MGVAAGWLCVTEHYTRRHQSERRFVKVGDHKLYKTAAVYGGVNTFSDTSSLFKNNKRKSKGK